MKNPDFERLLGALRERNEEAATELVRRYESAIKGHKLLLVAHGSPQELLKSREVLRVSRPDEMDLHFADEGVQSAA